MRPVTRVTAAVTALDVGSLAVLALPLDVPVPLADAVAVGTASVASFVLHRRITFAEDPFVRWVHQPAAVAVAAGLAAAMDVSVVVALTGPGAAGLFRAKLLALVVAGGFRLLAYRAVLWTHIRQGLAAREPRPDPPGDVRLTVVVPAYGEADRIGDSVVALRHALEPALGGDLEILVVDDGSPDATGAEAIAAGATVVRLPANRGKGGAVRAGVLAARGRTVAFTDADLAYPPDQLHAMLRAVEDGWDVVVGSRKHPDSVDAAGASVLRTLSGRLFNLLTATVLLGQYRDTQCGFKAFRSDAARLLFGRSRLESFAFDVEILHLVERYRLSLAEVPVRQVSAHGSTVRVGLDAARMVRDLFRVRRWAAQGLYDRVPTPSDHALSGREAGP